jgi:hypothetical protein
MEVHVLVRLASLSLLFASLGCGSSTPEPAWSEQSSPVDGARRTGPAVAMDADIGALDEAKVLSTFQSAQPAISRCLTNGAERLPYLAGRVRFHVRVDQSGKATSVHLEASDIGDRTTEQCMLRALAQKSWPSPEGGREGIAKTEFSFDPPGNARPPVDWSLANAGKGGEKLETELERCKREAGAEDLTAVAYVDTDGKVLAIGVSGSDPKVEVAADCVVAAAKAAELSSPGSWVAKLHLSVR